jgi:DNA-directed RNA polymerase specialized sigma24 family protein
MNYIDNKSLLEEIKSFSENGIQSERLGKMLLLLAKKYSEKGNFAGYTYKDDMICEAVLTCIKYMHNFNPNIENPNPFAYFSRIIHNSFLNYISKQKKHSAIKDICYRNMEVIYPDSSNNEKDSCFFEVYGIDYQPIRGNKKKQKRKRS